MSAYVDDELGSVDWVVIELPEGANPFDGPMADELAVLVESELVRVLDVVVITKDRSGAIGVVEFEELDGAGPLTCLAGRLAEVLSQDDIERTADEMVPGSSAVLLVWEHTWSVPFAAAARMEGGELVASGRVPTQTLVDAVDARTETVAIAAATRS